METNHFALYKGKIVYVPDVPDEADFTSTHQYGRPEQHTVSHPDMYKQAIQSAIANGIEVENWDSVRWKRDDIKMEEGKLYTLQCRVEEIKQVRDAGEWFPCSDKDYEYYRSTSNREKQRKTRIIARVIFEQPEKVAGFDYKQRRQETSFSRKVQPEAAGQEQEAYTLDDLRQAFWAGRWRPGLSFENYLEYKQQKP